jgi:hypothetical protein
MKSRIYSVLFQFNYGIEQALTALDTLEKMDSEPPKYVQQIRVRFQEVAANANAISPTGCRSRKSGNNSTASGNAASKRRKRIQTASTCAWQRRKTFAGSGVCLLAS